MGEIIIENTKKKTYKTLKRIMINGYSFEKKHLSSFLKSLCELTRKIKIYYYY
jgi:hypothetical protein